MAKNSAKAAERTANVVVRAASRAEGKLSSVAPLLLRMLRRSIFGVNREEKKEQLGLAQLSVLLLKVERGAIKTTLADVSDTKGKIVEVVANKAAAATATAVASIEAARVAAVASTVAMGLSAARNATLAAIILTLSDAAKAAAGTASNTAAQDGAQRVLTRTEGQQTDKMTALDDSTAKMLAAIVEEGARLGINI